MVPLFSEVTIQRVCIHTINKKESDEEHSSPSYDEAIIKLDDDVHETITKRLNTYCGEKSRSFELEILDALETGFYVQAQDMRKADEPTFIAKTKAIALLLAKSQTNGKIPPSCLVVMDAVDKNALPLVICIKAELTDALTQETNNGVSLLKKVEKLFMGRSEKFFKIGIVYKRATPVPLSELVKEPNDLWGAILYDHQFRASTKPAEYFWRKFLGFSIDSNDKIKLKRLYDQSVDFIEKNLGDDVEARSEALASLDEYVSNKLITEIDPAHIMKTVIPEDKRDDFNEAIRLEFTRPFTKDAALVARKIARSRMEFPDKLVLGGPKEAFTRVEVIETQADLDSLKVNDGYTIIRIKGNPNRILRYDQP